MTCIRHDMHTLYKAAVCLTQLQSSSKLLASKESYPATYDAWQTCSFCIAKDGNEASVEQDAAQGSVGHDQVVDCSQ